MKRTPRRSIRAYFLLALTLTIAGSLFAASSIYDFTLPSIDGKPMPLASFKGKVALLVNVASSALIRRNTRRSKLSMKSTRIEASWF
jgi:hypothetical protein